MRLGVETQEYVIMSTSTIEWIITRSRGSEYVLRNVGRSRATGVTADGAPFQDLARRLPEGAVIEAHASVSFTITSAYQIDAPRELRLKWDQQEGWINIPLP
ncbi:hypothetical protein [Sphaerisporangium aureirubrum]|uniref:Uncharacterized protein n=1 Tax=Sphaerisporangium aureirubrum TaxID=1544736 RepID=A0ABW1NDA3_9ACTN